MINQHIDLSYYLTSHSVVRTVKKNVREKTGPVLLRKNIIIPPAGRHTWTSSLRIILLDRLLIIVKTSEIKNSCDIFLQKELTIEGGCFFCNFVGNRIYDIIILLRFF